MVNRSILLAGLALAAPAAAQEHAAHDDGGPRRWALSAQAIPLLTHATPALYGESRTEGYLTQPMVSGHLGAGPLELRGTLNLEGLTLERGELNAGIWGEGYVDRRHPHTYLHELVATLRTRGAGRASASLSAGRGFVPFGTDDPMARPFVKYPVNHHLAQVLERGMVAGALRVGPAAVEGALFHGDEPVSPSDLGSLDRIGDSWAARLTLWPAAGVELQGSHARIASPEMASGLGVDHRKWSASARWAGASGLPYALVEWARTTEWDDGREGSSYPTLLAEAAAPWRGLRLSGRLERTDRGEEERLLNPFRTPRPHAGAHVLGVTRWTIATAQVASAGAALGPLRARPFGEVAWLRARETIRPSFFVPAEFYGSETMWSFSIGARLELGAAHTRMGRYGAGIAPTGHTSH